MKHCFIDCETMGPEASDCAVVDFSFIVVDSDRFTSDNPYTLKSISEVKRFKLSVKDQVDNYGFIVYKSTVEDFWAKLPPEVRKHAVPKSTDLPVKQFITEVTNYLGDFGKIHYWWSRSNTFDPIILARLFVSEQKYTILNEYLPHWKVRDVRTFIDAKLDFPKKNGFVPIDDEDLWNRTFVEHDSSWDVLADVLRMQKIIRIENDLED
jgi:hypothetical protein